MRDNGDPQQSHLTSMQGPNMQINPSQVQRPDSITTVTSA